MEGAYCLVDYLALMRNCYTGALANGPELVGFGGGH